MTIKELLDARILDDNVLLYVETPDGLNPVFDGDGLMIPYIYLNSKIKKIRAEYHTDYILVIVI